MSNIKICRKCKVPKYITDFDLLINRPDCIVRKEFCISCQRKSNLPFSPQREINGIMYTIYFSIDAETLADYEMYLVNIEGNKRCKNCNKVKHKSCFKPHKRRLDKLAEWCKTCTNAKYRKI